MALWLKVVVALPAMLLLAFLLYVLRNVGYHAWDMRRVRRAGFIERDESVNGFDMHYAEGPGGGPPLLLIHGQAVDWTSYARVLPALSRRFHVYVVDCPGHGGSGRLPGGDYTACAAGQILADFAAQVIAEPFVVSGHSSGGQLAAWVAAALPAQVRGVVLEDPPMFTTAPPRSQSTWNHVDLATSCHTFLEQTGGDGDFVAHFVQHSRIWGFFGDASEKLIQHGLDYHRRHPDRPVRYWFLPPLMNEMYRALPAYDPRFGDAFWTGEWDRGLDQAWTLSQIAAPTVLIHANWKYGEDGILQGAMDDRDAARALACLREGTLVRVDSGHGVHFEKPREFVRIVSALGLSSPRRR